MEVEFVKTNSTILIDIFVGEVIGEVHAFVVEQLLNLLGLGFAPSFVVIIGAS